MQITVKLYLAFRTGRFHTRLVDLPERDTIAAVVRRLAIDESEVGLAMVNGRQADPDRTLAGGDTLQLFPIVGGG